ncbi:MAG: sulfurtransferase [Candidatus Methylomirabilales bacterium]
MAGYAHGEVLVETQWVADHLKDPKIRLVEVDVDTAAYGEGHVPGAIGWNWKSDLEERLERDIVHRQTLEKLLSRSGIQNDTTVILYGDNNNWFATYAFWLLKYYGHADARVMNGGRVKWIAEGRPMTKEVPNYPATTYKAQKSDKSIRVVRDEVIGAVGKAGLALVDVRSPKEFSGEIVAPENLPQEGAQRGGHIPGAANIPWSQAVKEDGTFKSAEDLTQLYQGKGITPNKEIIAYCRIGERSSHTWFVLKYLLGYSTVLNYDGSWTEYGSLVHVPIEK